MRKLRNTKAKRSKLKRINKLLNKYPLSGSNAFHNVVISKAPQGYTKPPVIERKFYDVTQAASQITWTAAFGPAYALCVPLPGTGDSQRIGDQINLKSLYFSFNLYGEGNPASTIPTAVRIIIVQWHDLNTNFISFQQVLQAAGGTRMFIHSPYLHDNRTNFSVIYDKLISANQTTPSNVATPAAQIQSQSGKVTINLQKLKFVKPYINFLNATGDGHEHLFLLLISNQPAADAAVMDWCSRVTYTDS